MLLWSNKVLKWFSICEKVQWDVHYQKSKAPPSLPVSSVRCHGERARHTQKNSYAARQQINCRALMVINYQKGTRSTQHNQPVSVPQCSWSCSGQESPATRWWKGHPASVSAGAHGRRAEMEISLCDVTITVTAVNKVSTSDVCASVQRDLSSSSSSPCAPPCLCVSWRRAVALFTSLFQANYFVHQDAGYFQLLVTDWAQLIQCRRQHLPQESSFSKLNWKYKCFVRWHCCQEIGELQFCVRLRVCTSVWLSVVVWTFDLSVHALVCLSWRDIKMSITWRGRKTQCEWIQNACNWVLFHSQTTRRRASWFAWELQLLTVV